MDKSHKIGITFMIIGVVQILIIWLFLTPVSFEIDDDSASQLNAGEKREFSIAHSPFHTNKFILAVGQGFVKIPQPAEEGNVTLTIASIGQQFNFSYKLVGASSYVEYKWAPTVFELPVGLYTIEDTNNNSDDIDYRIMNAGFFRNLDDISGDLMDGTETGIFYFSIVGVVAFVGIGLYVGFAGSDKTPDYTRSDYGRIKYKAPKTKKKETQLAPNEDAFWDDFEKKVKKKKPESWEWED
jgi:hypothetical protein